MAEVGRAGEAITNTKNGNLFCYIGLQGGRRGVGFFIKKGISGKLMEFKGISDRVTLASFNFGKQKLTIIQAYPLQLLQT